MGSALIDYIDIEAEDPEGRDPHAFDGMPSLGSRVLDRTDSLLKEAHKPGGCLHVLGSVMALTERAKSEVAKKGWEATPVLRKLLARVSDQYDFVFIDTPPSADALSSVALAAADYVVAVCNPRLATADGARVVRNNTARVPERTGGVCSPVFIGTIINEARSPSKRSDEADDVDGFLSKWDLEPFSSEIRTSDQISASYGVSRPIVIDAPSFAASRWYEELANELVQRIRTVNAA